MTAPTAFGAYFGLAAALALENCKRAPRPAVGELYVCFVLLLRFVPSIAVSTASRQSADMISSVLEYSLIFAQRIDDLEVSKFF